jgi:hypothetical protein
VVKKTLTVKVKEAPAVGWSFLFYPKEIAIDAELIKVYNGLK